MSKFEDIIMCANCGKGEEESGKLKACTACDMVKYCNRDCQIAHRPQHKKECRKRAAELHDEALFKEVEPEECPICLLPLPFEPRHSIFRYCCGKRICSGCMWAVMDEAESRGKQLHKGEVGICAFCRTRPAFNKEEIMKRLNKLMESGNGEAYYEYSKYIAPQDLKKKSELYLKAGVLGYVGAYFELGEIYMENRGGFIMDKKKAKYYHELAAMNGHVGSRIKLGLMEMEGHACNYNRAAKHYLVAAKAGSEKAINAVKEFFKEGIITKDEYANALRAYHEQQLERKSVQRDEVASVLSSEFVDSLRANGHSILNSFDMRNLK